MTAASTADRLLGEDRCDGVVDADLAIGRNGPADAGQRLAQFPQLELRELPVLGLAGVVELEMARLDQHGHQVVHRRLEFEDA